MKIKLTKAQLAKITEPRPTTIKLTWNEVENIVSFAKRHKLDEGCYNNLLLEVSDNNGIGRGLTIAVNNYPEQPIDATDITDYTSW